MAKARIHEYTINEVTKTIHLPPVYGGRVSWSIYARKVFFKRHFGLIYSQVILNRKSWEQHIETNQVKTMVEDR